MNKGKYIVIEGAEGVGKTTMVQKVAGALQAAGLPVRIMREPDSQNDLTARAIRHLTQSPLFPMNTKTEVLLYNAARSQSLEVIRQCRDNGIICLVDRSYLTTLAIQYYGRGDIKDYKKINEIIEFAVGDMQPDLMLVLDAPVAELKKRTSSRHQGERFDNLDEAFLERVRAGYLWEAQQRQLPVVYATGDVEAVFKEVWKYITATLAIRDKEQSASKPISVAEVIAQKQVTKTASATVGTIVEAQLPTTKTTDSTPVITGSAAETSEPSDNFDDVYTLPTDLPASLQGDFKQAFDAIASARKSIEGKLQAYAKDVLAGQDADSAIKQALAGLSQQRLTVATTDTEQFTKLAYDVLSTTHGDTSKSVDLVSYSPHNELDAVSDILYAHSDMTKKAIINAVQKQSYDTKTTLFDEYCKSGQLDAFQSVVYEFDILSSGVSFAEMTNAKIFQHVEAQQPTPRYGYSTPKIVDDAGLAEAFATCFDISLQLYSIIQKLGDSRAATTATLLGHNMRWKAVLSANQLRALSELTAVVSPETQKLIGDIIEQINVVHPLTVARLAGSK